MSAYASASWNHFLDADQTPCPSFWGLLWWVVWCHHFRFTSKQRILKYIMVIISFSDLAIFSSFFNRRPMWRTLSIKRTCEVSEFEWMIPLTVSFTSLNYIKKVRQSNSNLYFKNFKQKHTISRAGWSWTLCEAWAPLRNSTKRVASICI